GRLASRDPERVTRQPERVRIVSGLPTIRSESDSCPGGSFSVLGRCLQEVADDLLECVRLLNPWEVPATRDIFQGGGLDQCMDVFGRFLSDRILMALNHKNGRTKLLKA